MNNQPDATRALQTLVCQGPDCLQESRADAGGLPLADWVHDRAGRWFCGVECVQRRNRHFAANNDALRQADERELRKQGVPQDGIDLSMARLIEEHKQPLVTRQKVASPSSARAKEDEEWRRLQVTKTVFDLAIGGNLSACIWWLTNMRNVRLALECNLCYCECGTAMLPNGDPADQGWTKQLDGKHLCFACSPGELAAKEAASVG